jgi:hypothetical protein
MSTSWAQWWRRDSINPDGEDGLIGEVAQSALDVETDVFDT